MKSKYKKTLKIKRLHTKFINLRINIFVHIFIFYLRHKYLWDQNKKIYLVNRVFKMINY